MTGHDAEGARVNLLLWAAAVVALLGVLILVHELGHFVLSLIHI